MANIYGGIDLIGGGTGAVDKINGSVLNDKDIFVTIKDGIFYPHWLDDDSNAGESSPLVISPDLNAGTKRWLLASGVFAGLTLYGNIVMADGKTIGQAAGPLIKFDDSNNRLGITGCDVSIGTLNPGGILYLLRTQVDSIMAMKVENQGATGATGAGYKAISDAGTAQFYATAASFPAASPSRCVLYTSDLDGINIITYKAGTDIRFFTSGQTASEERVRISAAGGLLLKELAAADVDVATFGQIWVKNTTPNELWFTDDAGTDHQIAYV